MTRTDWGWVVAKTVTGLVLPAALFTWTPLAVKEGRLSQGVLAAVLAFMILGGLLSIIGIVLRGTRVRPLLVGYAIEIAGIVSLILGPLILAGIYTTNAVITGNNPTGAVFCLCLAAPFVARGMDIMYTHLRPKSENDTAPVPPTEGAE